MKAFDKGSNESKPGWSSVREPNLLAKRRQHSLIRGTCSWGQHHITCWQKIFEYPRGGSYTDVTEVSLHQYQFALFEISGCLLYTCTMTLQVAFHFDFPLEWLRKSLWSNNYMAAVILLTCIWTFILRHSMHFTKKKPKYFFPQVSTDIYTTCFLLWQAGGSKQSQLGPGEMRMAVRWQITNANNSSLLLPFPSGFNSFVSSSLNILPLLQTLPHPLQYPKLLSERKIRATVLTFGTVLKLFDLKKTLHASRYFFQLLL